MGLVHHIMCLFKPKFHYTDFATKSGTSSQQSRGLVATLVANFHDLCPRQVRDFVENLFQTLSPTFPVHCNEPNSIKATQTGLSRTLSQPSRHVEMVCICDFRDLCQRLSLKLHGSWFVTICVRDIHDLCPRLSPQRSFGESRRNGIWTLGSGFCWYWLHLPTKRWPGRVALGDYLHTEMVYVPVDGHPSKY